jgi:hypothetical protein
VLTTVPVSKFNSTLELLGRAQFPQSIRNVAMENSGRFHVDVVHAKIESFLYK